jgi:transposase-like protein
MPRCLWSCLVTTVSRVSLSFQHGQIFVSIDSEVRLACGRTFGRMKDQERISSSAVARLIGVKTQTLAKWRCYGKGPRGWVRVSSTLVTYPISEVEAYLAHLPRDASR